MARIRTANLEARPDTGDRAIAPEQLVKLAPFAGLPAKRMETYPGAFVLRAYDADDVVCEQGEPGWTAFYVLSASELSLITGETVPDGREPKVKMRVLVNERVDTPMHRRSGADSGGFLGRLFARMDITRNAPRVVTSTVKRKQVATLFEGELFGEMACMNRSPRSATIIATEPVFVVEMLRHILQIAQDNKANKTFKEQLDAVYRQRAVQSHLTGFPLLDGIPDTVLAELRKRVELVEKKPGDVVFTQGEASDSLYLISVGQVKIVKKVAGGERVLNYRARGDVIGEVGLVRGAVRSASAIAYEHALRDGHRKPKTPGKIELIKVNPEVYTWLIEAAPVVKQRLDQRIETYGVGTLRSDEEQQVLALSARFHELGLPQGQKLMLIDLEKCTRCDDCVRACAATHEDHRSRLLREGPRFGKFLVPATCRQCRDPVCLLGCPVASIHKGPSGHIVIEDWCIGCKTCAEQCPYDAINMHELIELARAETTAEAPPAAPAAPVAASAAAGPSAVTVPTAASTSPPPANATASPPAAASPAPVHPTKPKSDTRDLAVVCDQCESLSDATPSCVYACPHDAAARIDAMAFFNLSTSGATTIDTIPGART